MLSVAFMAHQTPPLGLPGRRLPIDEHFLIPGDGLRLAVALVARAIGDVRNGGASRAEALDWLRTRQGTMALELLVGDRELIDEAIERVEQGKVDALRLFQALSDNERN